MCHGLTLASIMWFVEQNTRHSDSCTTAHRSGIQRVSGMQVAVAISFAHRMAAYSLLVVTGKPGPRNEDAEARAIGAAGLAYFRSRASAPRDLSANACHELREACLAVVKDTY